MKRSIALMTVLVLLCISGCGQQPVTNDVTTLPTVETTGQVEDTLPDYHFSKLEYNRPDVQEVLTAQEACKTAAQSGDWEQLSGAVTEYLELYARFDTMLQLATIHYSLDLTDSAWEEEYNYCSEQMVTVDLGGRHLGYFLAATEFVDQLEGEEYFGKNGLLYYKGENYLTEEVAQLLQEESSLQNQYYVLTEGVSAPDGVSLEALGELLVQLVKLRQRIATAAGFDSYGDFAYDYLYHRDYSTDQIRTYLDQVRNEVVPVLNSVGSYAPGSKSPASGSTFKYVKELSQNAGGTIAEAFELLETGELYDLSYADTKMVAGFTTYLLSYDVPYVFLNPLGGGAAVGFTHEFGHFCDGYVSGGRRPNVDTAEVYSQGMEYLSMFYADGTQNASEAYALLRIYALGAANADFELRLYELPEEEVTAENIVKLYAQVGTEWKLSYFGSFSKQGLLMTLHFYLSPMYMLSYSISCDTALQLYELEVQEAGAGLQCYEKLLASDQVQLLSLIGEAGLRSPFEPGAIEKSRDTFAQMMKK